MNVPAENLSYVEMILQHHANNPPEESDFRFEGKPEDHKHPHWDMVRELKDDHYMASLPGYQAIPILERVLGDLTALGYQSADEASSDLEILWDKVRLGAREGPLGAAARMADRFPVSFRTNRISKTYHRFLNIAYHLQAMREDDYISLPVVRLGEILFVSPMRVSDFRGFAQDEDGFLRQVAGACYSKTGGGIATKFRFECQLVDGVMVPLRIPTPRFLLGSRKTGQSKTEGLDPS